MFSTSTYIYTLVSMKIINNYYAVGNSILRIIVQKINNFIAHTGAHHSKNFQRHLDDIVTIMARLNTQVNKRFRNNN